MLKRQTRLTACLLFVNPLCVFHWYSRAVLVRFLCDSTSLTLQQQRIRNWIKYRIKMATLWGTLFSNYKLQLPGYWHFSFSKNLVFLTMSTSLTDLSQIQDKNDDAINGEESGANNPLTRRKLSRQFNSETNTQHPMLLRSRNVLSSINLNVANVPKETKKFFQAGTDKMNQKLRDARLTLGTWSQVNINILYPYCHTLQKGCFLFQRLKNPTRRRERLINNSPYTPGRTPRTKQLLGRTPTKLYRY